MLILHISQRLDNWSHPFFAWSAWLLSFPTCVREGQWKEHGLDTGQPLVAFLMNPWVGNTGSRILKQQRHTPPPLSVQQYYIEWGIGILNTGYGEQQGNDVRSDHGKYMVCIMHTLYNV